MNDIGTRTWKVGGINTRFVWKKVSRNSQHWIWISVTSVKTWYPTTFGSLWRRKSEELFVGSTWIPSTLLKDRMVLFTDYDKKGNWKTTSTSTKDTVINKLNYEDLSLLLTSQDKPVKQFGKKEKTHKIG